MVSPLALFFLWCLLWLFSFYGVSSGSFLSMVSPLALFFLWCLLWLFSFYGVSSGSFLSMCVSSGSFLYYGVSSGSFLSLFWRSFLSVGLLWLFSFYGANTITGIFSFYGVSSGSFLADISFSIFICVSSGSLISGPLTWLFQNNLFILWLFLSMVPLSLNISMVSLLALFFLWCLTLSSFELSKFSSGSFHYGVHLI